MCAAVWAVNTPDELMARQSGLFSFDRQHHQRRRRGQDKAWQHRRTFIFPREQKDIYIGPEQHSGLYLLITSDALISVFALFCRLLVRIALHQNIMDLAGHSATLTDHSRPAEERRWRRSRAPGEFFKTPKSFVWRQMRTH